jgi:GDP-L-fucose synthase
MSNQKSHDVQSLIDGKVFVAGHGGMVGTAIVRYLKTIGCKKLILAQRNHLDLTNQHQTNEFFLDEKPDYVFLAAAKVGGIHANNTYPADFIYNNIMISANVIHAAFESQAKRLLLLGSSCIYPKLAAQPLTEASLLTGKLEPTNEPYAIAKIAGIKLCEAYNRQYGCDFRSLMPTNLYGPFDNFDLETSHVLPALIRKFHEAKSSGSSVVEIWGTGTPRREFLHVNDMADASVHFMSMNRETVEKVTTPTSSHINIGTGHDVSIAHLAGLVGEVVGFSGKIAFNESYPDGTPRKLLDVSLASSLGWTSKINLRDGISATYEWFCDNY